MKTQLNVIKQFMMIFKKPTLNKISTMTGIQLTRVFRIINGSEMKLSEYEIFQEKIDDEVGIDRTLRDLLNNCEHKLSRRGILEIQDLLEEQLQIWYLTH